MVEAEKNLSNHKVEKFFLPDFTVDEAGGGKLFPRMDQDHRGNHERNAISVQDADGMEEDVSTFEENFTDQKEKNKKDVFSFQTEFTSENDIKTLLKNAEKKAAEMIAHAGSEVDRIQQEAYQKGYEDGKEVGYKESREEGKRKLLPCIDAFEKTLTEMAACRKLIYKNCEAELMELFNALSLKVIHRELGRSNEFLQDVIREAMKEVAQQESITVRLNPEDVEYAESFKADVISEFGTVRNIVLKKDNSITRGGCVIETNFGEIDSRVETKLREIEKEILGEKPEKEAYKTPET